MYFLYFIVFIYLSHPNIAYAKYGRDSNEGLGFLLFIVVCAAIIFIYKIIYENENKKAEKKFENKLYHEKEKLKKELEIRVKELTKRQQLLDEKEMKLEGKIILQEKLFSEKTKGFPWVAEAYSRVMAKKYDRFEKYFLTKNNPSIKSADIVRDLKKDVKELEKNCFIYQGIISYYENLFPWLTEFRDAPDDAIAKTDIKDTSNDDPASKLLSHSEWNNLSKTEKFQKALDRYQARHKTNWEIGRDFERFVGYEYECEGWDVTFYGAIQGFEDMGRDLIVKKNNSIKIIQCKYWAKEKTIHEKHIFQLFGTCVSYSLNNGIINQKQTLQQQSVVEGVFIASCSLSETAKMVASILGIKIIEFKKLEKYPCVKCNIGKNGEKIYHLPFDQNYDKIKIEPNKGEFYCKTIREAEDAGFRRAYKWRGNKS